MRNAMLDTCLGVLIALLLLVTPLPRAQEQALTSDRNETNDSTGLVLGHPFSAVKFARQVRALGDGKLQFIRNERYPIRIARDADGRLMMQMQPTDTLGPECDHLELLVPPVCTDWGVFVIDPVAHTVTHWPAGEIGAHIAVDFPLTESGMKRAVHATAELPDVPPDFTDEDGEVSTADLGDKLIDGIRAHGVRATLRYAKNDSGKTIYLARIHEVWISAEMKLIVRVIDGDPNGIETVWGLEKISLSLDPSLFQPPADYELQHRRSGELAWSDFEYLESWFSK